MTEDAWGGAAADDASRSVVGAMRGAQASVFFAFFALTWIFPYAALTLRARGWLTR